SRRGGGQHCARLYLVLEQAGVRLVATRQQRANQFVCTCQRHADGSVNSGNGLVAIWDRGQHDEYAYLSAEPDADIRQQRFGHSARLKRDQQFDPAPSARTAAAGPVRLDERVSGSSVVAVRCVRTLCVLLRTSVRRTRWPSAVASY